jgi:hypothetical protein
MHNSHYCLVAYMPDKMHNKADMVLATGLITGQMFLSQWIDQVNPWLAFIGGMLGLFIAGVRVYEIIKGFFIKPKR